METGKIMKEFRDYIGKKNGRMIGWLVTWITSVVFGMLAGNRIDSLPAGKLYGLGVIAFILAATHAYVRKYTRFYFSEMTKKGSDGLGLSVHNDMEDILQSMSFDPFAYCYLLGKGLLPLQLGSAAVLMIGVAIRMLSMGEALLLVSAYCMLPWLLLFIKALELHYCMTHACGFCFGLITGAAGAICDLARILMMGISFVWFALRIVGWLGTDRLLASADQGTAVRFGCDAGIMLASLIVMVVLLSFFASGLHYDATFNIWAKTRLWLIVLLLAGTVLSAGVILYQINYNHLRLEKDSITLRQGGNEKVYGLDEIESYRIFCKNDAMEMEVMFRDGEKTTLFKDFAEETEEWSKNFYGDANYASYLVDRLKEKGIVGSLEDKAKIEEGMKDYDQELKDAFEHITEVLGASF